ncbi:hypothetical protein GCM10010193_25700 [Kitasatospora atroaurantiaca]|uniref:Anti-anti-sigma factor n=1 Tax=Kitasatospora atroaurantiaca TaxID=285545 RepID=A0A561F0H0_9ACTN|nr:STAS domain-containing protein [Kitasatospora atroaurantiaca]TWE21365.1 anti-anti-sigma factor [Kitasatospora atroaurantiaca]
MNRLAWPATVAADWLAGAVATAWIALAIVDQTWFKTSLLVACAWIVQRAGREMRAALQRLRPGRARAPGPRTVLVRLRGTIDTANADQVAHRLRAALRSAPARIEIDLARVPHITPSGSTALLALTRTARETGSEIVIRNAAPQPRAALRAVGLDRLATFQNDEPPHTGGGRA